MRQTVDELIEEVRLQTEESGTSNIKDEHILKALNRGQKKTAEITARRYDNMFLDTKTVVTSGGSRDLDLPPEAFGNRVEFVEVEQNGIFHKLDPIRPGDAWVYKDQSTSSIPSWYSVTKNKLSLYPTPTSGVTVKISFFRSPEKLIKSQGQITSFDSVDNFVLLDAVGEKLSTSASYPTSGAYVNVVDFNTGVVKASLQINEVNPTTKKITFKTTGLTRSRVLNKTIDTELPSDIQVDDFLCLVDGTCIPEIPEAYTEYALQYGVVSTRRRLKEDIQADLVHLKDLEKDLSKMARGRERSFYVKKKSSWSTRRRRSRRFLSTTN